MITLTTKVHREVGVDSVGTQNTRGQQQRNTTFNTQKQGSNVAINTVKII